MLSCLTSSSRSEGWPCVVWEAQACGACVVGSSNGGISEAIGFEECVIEEGESFEKRFGNKVVQILENGYNSRELIQRAKEYTWKKIVEREIRMIYEEIRAKRGGKICQ